MLITKEGENKMAGNRCVVYVEPGKVQIENIAYPKLELEEQHRKCDHGVILKIVATNICGSDQHMTSFLYHLILPVDVAACAKQATLASVLT
jgi:threonine dehydrogenase-like Zn-dependent dehydrogenase